MGQKVSAPTLSAGVRSSGVILFHEFGSTEGRARPRKRNVGLLEGSKFGGNAEFAPGRPLSVFSPLPGLRERPGP